MFRNAGLVVECEHNVFAGYRLYITPADTVSLRVELFRDSPYWCRKNQLSTKALSTYQAVPTGFETLPPDDWAEFRSAMSDHAWKSDMATRLHFVRTSAFSVLTVVFPPLAISSADFLQWLMIVLIVLFISIWIGHIFLDRSLQELAAQRTLLVRDYAARFERQGGVLMEYRMVSRFHWCSGRYTCHYLYLFPRTATGAVNDRG